MTPDQQARAATLLADARRERRLVDPFPPEAVPATMEQGYAVQDAVRARLAQPLVGWKTGATAAAVQAKFGVAEPFAGPVLAPDLFVSPARIPAAHFPHRLLECEIAFRVGKPLPPRREPYSRDEVLAAIDAVLPAIEMVGPRLRVMPFGQPALAIADGGVNAALIVGTPMPAFDVRALPDLAVKLLIDGKVVAEGIGRNVLGDPVASLAWTANHLSARGIGLDTGQYLSSGTITGITPLAPEARAVGDFGPLGRVELRLTGPAHPDAVA